MRIAASLLAAAAVTALAGCNGPASYATKQVDLFHQRLDSGDYEAIWRDTGPDIRDTTSREAFIKMLATVHERLGRVRETKQTGWSSHMDTAGSYAELTHRTTFERGAGEETFVYKGSGQGQKLAGWHIKPIGGAN
jgi:hypothetical protein